MGGQGLSRRAPHPHAPTAGARGDPGASRESRGQGCSRFIWFSFGPREGPAEAAPPGSSTRLSKDNRVCVLRAARGSCQLLGWCIGGEGMEPHFGETVGVCE